MASGPVKARRGMSVNGTHRCDTLIPVLVNIVSADDLIHGERAFPDAVKRVVDIIQFHPQFFFI